MRLGLGAAEAPSRLRLGLELADGDATEDDHERHPRGDEREPDGRQEGLDGHHGGPTRLDEAKAIGGSEAIKFQIPSARI